MSLALVLLLYPSPGGCGSLWLVFACVYSLRLTFTLYMTSDASLADYTILPSPRFPSFRYPPPDGHCPVLRPEGAYVVTLNNIPSGELQLGESTATSGVAAGPGPQTRGSTYPLSLPIYKVQGNPHG